jgi:hypothetical protein
MAKFTRNKPKWVAEQGVGYDLREYAGGKPTGRFAVIRTPDERTEYLPGKHVVLRIDRRRVTIASHVEPRGILLRIPWQSMAHAGLHDEPGTARLRLDMAVWLGVTTVQLVLWFDATHRSALDRLVAHIHTLTGTPPTAEPVRAQDDTPTKVPLLDVHRAPTGDDWIVFLPGECSAEVLRIVPNVTGAVE